MQTGYDSNTSIMEDQEGNAGRVCQRDGRFFQRDEKFFQTDGKYSSRKENQQHLPELEKE